MTTITCKDDLIIIDLQGSDEEEVNCLVLDVVTEGEYEAIDALLEEHTLHSHDYLVDEDFYQGMNLMRVLERKSDGRLFGFQYWYGGGKYGVPFIEENGDNYDLEATYDDDFNYITGPYYVFAPVKRVTFTGYTYDEVE